MLMGQSRVAQHRAINDTLRDEFASGVHALAIEVMSTGSPQRPAADSATNT
jgi:BolA protein